MHLTIKKRTYNDTGENVRTYMTEDDEVILDFLDFYYDKKEDIFDFLNDIDQNMTCMGNSMDLHYDDKEDNKVSYDITFDNNKTTMHFTIP